MLTKLPKAELHVHLDGTLTPQLVKQLALKNQQTLNAQIFSLDGEQFIWRDFSQFHQVFDESFKVIRSGHDYQYIIYIYLQKLAQKNCLYVELIISPFHAELNQISYESMLQGLINGIEQAYRDFGIEARLLMAFIRQQGPVAAMRYMDQVLQNQHPYVVGINLVGDIKQYEIKVFDKVFDRARVAQLGLSCHAGEIDGGPEEIWQAVDILGVSRISHGVCCVEDPKLVNYLLEKKIMLEVCPTSNVILKMYADYATHPLQQLKDAGLLLCLNTDDPGFFQVDLTHEYKVAKTFCGFSEKDLCDCTEQALHAGFMDQATKERCLIEFRKRSPYNILKQPEDTGL